MRAATDEMYKIIIAVPPFDQIEPSCLFQNKRRLLEYPHEKYAAAEKMAAYAKAKNAGTPIMNEVETAYTEKPSK